jgi:phosphatidylglycerophosphate synthase
MMMTWTGARELLGQQLAMASMTDSMGNARRPIPERRATWAISAARWLQRAGVQPNHISLFGVGMAAAGAVCLILAGRNNDGLRAALFLGAAVTVPVRLLCNMLDGMLAVEGGLKTVSGDLYNELPDRLADLLFLAGAGYAITGVTWGPELGWAAATTALLTAYVRTLGVAAGATQHFDGPMAKPRRMHVLLVACLVSAIVTLAGWRDDWVMVVALAIIIAGGVVTIARRLGRIVADLESA